MDRTPHLPGWRVLGMLYSDKAGVVYEICQEHDPAVRASLKVISIPSSSADIHKQLEKGCTRESLHKFYLDQAKNITDELSLLKRMQEEGAIVGCEEIRAVPHPEGVGCQLLIRSPLLMSLPEYAAQHPLSRDDLLYLGLDICDALDMCVKKGITHGAIEPGSIFITADGHFKLGNFGAAKISDAGTDAYSYMAPEVYSRRPTHSSSDLYAVGLVLYEYLNGGRLPFLSVPTAQATAEQRNDALTRRISGEPLPPPAIDDEILCDLILTACQHDPLQRFETAAALRRAFSICLSRQEPPAPQQMQTPEYAPEPVEQHFEPAVREPEPVIHEPKLHMPESHKPELHMSASAEAEPTIRVKDNSAEMPKTALYIPKSESRAAKPEPEEAKPKYFESAADFASPASYRPAPITPAAEPPAPKPDAFELEPMARHHEPAAYEPEPVAQHFEDASYEADYFDADAFEAEPAPKHGKYHPEPYTLDDNAPTMGMFSDRDPFEAYDNNPGSFEAYGSPHGAPAAKKDSNKTLWIILIVLGVLILAIGGYLLYDMVFSGNGSSAPSGSSSSGTTTQPDDTTDFSTMSTEEDPFPMTETTEDEATTEAELTTEAEMTESEMTEPAEEETEAVEELPAYPGDAVSYDGHHYYVFDHREAWTWLEAEQFCKEQGGYLAVVSDRDEDRFLYSLMAGEGYENAYIGYSDVRSEGRWSWSDEENSTYTNWYPGEPNNYQNYEHYAMYYVGYEDGTWNDDNGLIFDFGSNVSVSNVYSDSYLTEGTLLYTADMLIDGLANTCWAEGVAGQGIGESITFDFGSSSQIAAFTIYGGFQSSLELYTKNSRPKLVELTFSDGSTMEFELSDIRDAQQIFFDKPITTSSVTLTIRSVYPGSAFEDTTISEVSFQSAKLNTGFICEWDS